MIASKTDADCLVDTFKTYGIDMSDGGKGSTQRPRSIADEEWANRWDNIFGRDRYSDIQERAKRDRALDEMVKINQELGLYDDKDST